MIRAQSMCSYLPFSHARHINRDTADVGRERRTRCDFVRRQCVIPRHFRTEGEVRQLLGGRECYFKYQGLEFVRDID